MYHRHHKRNHRYFMHAALNWLTAVAALPGAQDHPPPQPTASEPALGGPTHYTARNGDPFGPCTVGQGGGVHFAGRHPRLAGLCAAAEPVAGALCGRLSRHAVPHGTGGLTSHPAAGWISSGCLLFNTWHKLFSHLLFGNCHGRICFVDRPTLSSLLSFVPCI